MFSCVLWTLGCVGNCKQKVWDQFCLRNFQKWQYKHRETHISSIFNKSQQNVQNVYKQTNLQRVRSTKYQSRPDKSKPSVAPRHLAEAFVSWKQTTFFQAGRPGVALPCRGPKYQETQLFWRRPHIRGQSTTREAEGRRPAGTGGLGAEPLFAQFGRPIKHMFSICLQQIWHV